MNEGLSTIRLCDLENGHFTEPADFDPGAHLVCHIRSLLLNSGLLNSGKLRFRSRLRREMINYLQIFEYNSRTARCFETAGKVSVKPNSRTSRKTTFND